MHSANLLPNQANRSCTGFQAKLALLPDTKIKIRERGRPSPEKRYYHSPTSSDSIPRLLAGQCLNNRLRDYPRQHRSPYVPFFGFRYDGKHHLPKSLALMRKFLGAGTKTAANCFMGRIHISLGGTDIGACWDQETLNYIFNLVMRYIRGGGSPKPGLDYAARG